MMTSSTHRCPRLAAFGVGRMGQVHLEHLIRQHQGGHVRLVAIGDRYPPMLETAGRLLADLGGAAFAGIQRFETPERMAAEIPLDGVVISSRTADHARDTLAFTRRGVRVLVEKPLADSIREAAALSAALGEDGRRLVQVGFQRHYDEAARRAVAWVGAGRLGTLQQSHHVLQDKNPTPAGYQSSGITADMAIHLVYEAMSVHAFALPATVQALRFLTPHYDDRAGEGANVVHVLCTWRDGSLAHLWGSRINSAGYDNGFTLIGTGGRIDVGGFVGDFGTVEARLWGGAGAGRGTLLETGSFTMTRPAPRHPDFYARFASAYAAEVSAFVEGLGSGAPLVPGVEVGWQTLFVAELAEASARAGGRRFDLLAPDGSEIAGVEDAAAFARPGARTEPPTNAIE